MNPGDIMPPLRLSITVTVVGEIAIGGAMMIGGERGIIITTIAAGMAIMRAIIDTDAPNRVWSSRMGNLSV